jgi:hypothetical protein
VTPVFWFKLNPVQNQQVHRAGFSTSDGLSSRTALYGPVRRVVWQGSVGDRRPYADLTRYTETKTRVTNLKRRCDLSNIEPIPSHLRRHPIMTRQQLMN